MSPRPATLSAERGTFNLIDTDEGEKVDFWLSADEPFNASRLSRRRGEDVLGIRVLVSAPEDTVLAKLRWAKLSGGSEKHFIDALRVYEVQFGVLDLDYLTEVGRLTRRGRVVAATAGGGPAAGMTRT